MKKFDENLKAYLKEVGKQKVLSREEEIDLFKRLKKGDDAARELIVKSNLRFVIKIALSYVGRGLPIADLIQEGNLGLLEVIDKYDHTKGYRFSTYAAFWIRQAIQIALRKNSSLIKIPNCKARLLGKVSETVSVLLQELGCEPTVYEIAERMNISERKVETLLKLRESIISLDAEYTEDTDPLIINVNNKDEVSARDHCIKKQVKDKITHLLLFLNERERMVVRLRFGFVNGRSLSLRKTSRLVGLSQEGVRRIERRAIAKLQRPTISSQVMGLL